MSDSAGETCGVLGGSFDPPHVSHVLLAAYALSSTPIDRLVVVPTFEHALDKRAGAPFADRVRMCELAFSDLRRLEISRIEEELGGTSYTLRTLEALGRRWPGTRLRLVIGADLLAETSRWHRYDEIERIAPPLIVGRAGHPLPPSAHPILLPDVSSTLVRARLRDGAPVEGLVPRAVEAYARERGLYAGSAA